MSDWSLVYEGCDPASERLREALCTLGNGIFATRGTAPEAVASRAHYPGTYLAGCYNRLVSQIDGHEVEDESLVNAPNWLPIAYRIEDAHWFHPDADTMLEYRQELDLRQGILHRSFVWVDPEARRTRVTQRRLVSMAEPHLAALETTFTAENWSGRLTVRHALDGSVENTGVERYRKLASQHLTRHETRAEGDRIALVAETSQSRIRIGLAARVSVHADGAAVEVERRTHETPGHIAQEFDLDLRAGTPATVEKIVAIYTSRDIAISEPDLAAWELAGTAGSFDALSQAHVLRWDQIWRRCDIEIQPGGRAQLLLRLHLFHLMQVTAPHAGAVDAGVPARGLHGEAYRGHVFWDELFMYPLLTLRAPRITRDLLLYRHRRLDAARRIARQQGFEGALYPWQSGSTGREETPRIHLNPRSGRWLPDHSHLQRHINAAIAYVTWRYYEATGDIEFLARYGAEMLVEIARFFSSAATYNRALDRYELRGVLGPDEYHDALPGADAPGLPNNTYTNVMAAWSIGRTLDAIAALPERSQRTLEERLGLRQEEIEHWREVARKMLVVFHADGILTQFEGYEALEEFDWDGYRKRLGNIQRLDRILEAEGDTPNRYRLSKQADVLMLLFLFSGQELEQIFAQLGYPWSADDIPRTVDFYQRRTSHGSTLSGVVHSWVLSRVDRSHSWQFFERAIEADISDVQGGTTEEGIHLGAMAGTADIVLRCYTGIEVHDGVLWLNPHLPGPLEHIRFSLVFRGIALDLDVSNQEVVLTAEHSNLAPFRVGVWGSVREIVPGGHYRLPNPEGR